MKKYKAKPLTRAELEIFELSFHNNTGTSRMQCACGRVFYNSTGNWDWDDGELEGYHADKNAIDVDHTILALTVQGKDVADACTCWHGEAAMIYRWLIAYRYQVVEFYRRVKNHLQKEAEAFPVVNEEAI
jgi:hypothetical protein